VLTNIILDKMKYGAKFRPSPPKWPSTRLFEDYFIWQTWDVQQRSWK